MPAYSDICLWFQTYKLDALKKALKPRNSIEEIYRIHRQTICYPLSWTESETKNFLHA